MFNKTKGFVMGFICCAIIVALAGTAFASSKTENISVTYKDIKIVVDGVSVTPKDAAGNVVEPFVSNGTTYLPVRAIGEALGKAVEWDASTGTVFVGKKPGSIAQALVKEVPPYDTDFLVDLKDNVMMGGTIYYDAITFDQINSVSSRASFHNLNKSYTKVSGCAGKIDGAFSTEATLRFFGDGKLIEAFQIKGDEMAKQFEVNVSGVTQLKIEFIGIGLSSSNYALSATIE